MAERFYIGSTPAKPGDVITLGPEESHHLLRVMRFKVGAAVEVFGDGRDFTAVVLDADGRTARLQLKDARPSLAPPRVYLTMAIPYLKGGRSEMLVQKLTEIGASQVSVYAARHAIAQGGESKVAKLQEVAVQACKQCGRSDVPRVRFAASLEAALVDATADAGHSYILHEKAQESFVTAARQGQALPTRVTVACGPEGGLSDEEVDSVREMATPVLLGKRIMRAETAPLVAAALALGFFGEYD